jgi:hypothetical protein
LLTSQQFLSYLLKDSFEMIDNPPIVFFSRTIDKENKIIRKITVSQ